MCVIRRTSAGCGAERGITIDVHVVPAVLPTTRNQGQDKVMVIFTPSTVEETPCTVVSTVQYTRNPHPHNPKRLKVMFCAYIYILACLLIIRRVVWAGNETTYSELRQKSLVR